MPVAQPPQVLVSHEGQLTVRECPDVAVQHGEVEALQIRHIAGEVKAGDLDLAARHGSL
jgi:pterin-4a-carbinolamine dehydratase